MLSRIFFPLFKISSVILSGKISPVLPIFSSVLLTLFSTTVHSAASVDIQGEPVTFNSTAPFNVTVEFSEPVTGFIDTEVSVANASVTDFIPVGGDTYMVQITPTNAADISIDIAADVALDAAMDGNLAAAQANIAFDNIPPIANAGPDQSIGEGSLVTLDGSGAESSATHGLTYRTRCGADRDDGTPNQPGAV